MSDENHRKKPNILITGTPGTGKTSVSELLAEYTGFSHVNIGTMVKEQSFHAGRDERFDSYIIDEDAEDKILDALEDPIANGGVIIDHHSCEFFPKRFFNLIIVLRANNTILYDRLKKRGYSDVKITENVECEIMQVVLDEAKSSYDVEIVQELKNDTIDDMEDNVERIGEWIKTFMANQGK
eukprot:g1384.t1